MKELELSASAPNTIGAIRSSARTNVPGNALRPSVARLAVRPVFAEHSSNLMNLSRAPLHEQIPRIVKRKNSLLLFVFGWHEPHSRALCGFPERRGISSISFVRL